MVIASLMLGPFRLSYGVMRFRMALWPGQCRWGPDGSGGDGENAWDVNHCARRVAHFVIQLAYEAPSPSSGGRHFSAKTTKHKQHSTAQTAKHNSKAQTAKAPEGALCVISRWA
jgi:hypothetical protein